MTATNGDIDAFFLAGSPLESVLDGFAPRRGQLEMARLVAASVSSGEHLAIEAGAGTGKTLAYLVPVLFSGRRAIIATATRTLQDQLYHRDLPLVGQALGRPVKVAQLKGRRNYLCPYRLKMAMASSMDRDQATADDLQRVAAWSHSTRSGDIAELDSVAEDSRVWPLVTSTADNCLGSQCPEFSSCHLVTARKRAASADVAVINHHLLLADMALQDAGFGLLVPGAEAVVVDEAHRFPETAQGWFDVRLGSRQIEELVRDITGELSQASLPGRLLGRQLDALLMLVADMRQAMPDTAAEPLELSVLPAAFVDQLAEFSGRLSDLVEALTQLEVVGVGMSRCLERLAALEKTAERLLDWQAQSDLCWVQGGAGSFAVHLTPLDSAGQLRSLLERQSCTWIFTSATLAVGEDFSFFTRRLGLDPIPAHRIDSPFDYAQCARLYLPPELPDPQEPDYTSRCLQAVRPILAASGGRAFLLFTSRRALRQAARLLRDHNEGHYQLLVQGSAPRSRLLTEFSRTDRAVLLGTATFWEGVDIRGPALVVVVIDRLPFAAPGDPFLKARLEQLRRQGGQPFRDYQLPQAVLALRQGVGRLIRGVSDYGVVVICDPRLRTRSYGRVFLRSLPPIPLVDTAAEACRFLEEHEVRTDG